MIEFIELIPESIENPNYQKELEEFEYNTDFAAMPPSDRIIRHSNRLLGQFEYVPLICNEKIIISGVSYTVVSIGNKVFRSGQYKQTVFVEAL